MAGASSTVKSAEADVASGQFGPLTTARYWLSFRAVVAPVIFNVIVVTFVYTPPFDY